MTVQGLYFGDITVLEIFFLGQWTIWGRATCIAYVSELWLIRINWQFVLMQFAVQTMKCDNNSNSEEFVCMQFIQLSYDMRVCRAIWVRSTKDAKINNDDKFHFKNGITDDMDDRENFIRNELNFECLLKYGRKTL